MNWLILGFMLATVVALFIGLGMMIKGGEANKKYGNKMMRIRIALQFVVIVMLGVMMFATKS